MVSRETNQSCQSEPPRIDIPIGVGEEAHVAQYRGYLRHLKTCFTLDHFGFRTLSNPTLLSKGYEKKLFDPGLDLLYCIETDWPIDHWRQKTVTLQGGGGIEKVH